MRVVRGIWLGVLLLPFAGLFAGCDTLENFQIWDTKKKLTGARQEVFPGGVPGVQQGIPPELVKGYQAPQEPTSDAAVVAAQESADKGEPKAKEKPKPKPKPKVAKVSRPKPARPRPAPQQAAPQAPPVQQAQAPQPAPQQAAPAPWPAQQPQQAAAPAPWPRSAQPQAPQPAPWPGPR